jgi:SpoVK/Ycf46/Vps4 family AAA+-type ATPase
MASSEQLKALLHSHIENDDERFLSIALQVAAHEARSGHGNLAKELRDIVVNAKKKNHKNIPVSIAKSFKDADNLLSVSYPKLKIQNLISPTLVKDKLERLIKEQRHFTKLKNHGLSPRRHILLIGPPGTGKTYTASILAGMLDYPLFQVRLDAVITKFMGETSAKLRQVFNAMNEIRGVYFFDEFDTLGSQRSSSNDVGESRRILNSFLQMIEQDDSNSIIVCATNHVEILDHALFRRFDDVIIYDLPTDDEIVMLFKNRLKPFVRRNFPWKKLPELSKGLSNAEIVMAAEDAVKEILINDLENISISLLEHAIRDRRNIRNNINYKE